jgi:hypothetical protein
VHVVTRYGAELNGHRFKPGTVLDLPEQEAAILIDGDMADFLDAPVKAAPVEDPPVAKRRAKS